ncbi:AraC family transcriptional regulator [Novosphingobium sp. 9]|uniref:AraC family transcriptional regulator n=1 Tax=Novosphingobium sp. 9 TaxID=2025349 RepID=UPI0021B6559C|nr:AraC family transcriptional regulator [Novosphingobium sp. 9]
MTDPCAFDPFPTTALAHDPLTQIVGLLRPSTTYSKLVEGHGRWRVPRIGIDRPFFCAVLEGACSFRLEDGEPVELRAGDFALVPSLVNDFTNTSLVPPPPGIDTWPVELAPGHYRLGEPGDPVTIRMVVGHCDFGSDDTQLLLSLLPRFVHVRGEPRLTTLVELVNGEARARRPGREVVMARLIEVLLIEALRTTSGPSAPPGLLRGLADERLSVALRAIHADPVHGWTIDELARVSALSRSSFHDRFRREVGLAPMEYLTAWRMALAKDLLRRERIGVAQVAARVGYTSASTFSTAFTRHVGQPPIVFAKGMPEPV